MKASKMNNNKDSDNNLNMFNHNNLNELNGSDNAENANINNFAFVPYKKKFVKKFGYKSQPGKNDNGLSKVNQDNFLIMENILNNDEFKIFGVFDGHGKKIF